MAPLLLPALEAALAVERPAPAFHLEERAERIGSALRATQLCSCQSLFLWRPDVIGVAFHLLLLNGQENSTHTVRGLFESQNNSGIAFLLTAELKIEAGVLRGFIEDQQTGARAHDLAIGHLPVSVSYTSPIRERGALDGTIRSKNSAIAR